MTEISEPFQTHIPIITGWWLTTCNVCVCWPFQHHYISCY